MANGDLINIAHCKKLALRFAQENRRGWLPNRVSKQFLDDLNMMVRNKITGAILHHPTKGKTITYLF
ncbi:MAG: hypothetical protein ACYS1A_19075 [Planctomycetota bacterium]|jgi:hypothetical protein